MLPEVAVSALPAGAKSRLSRLRASDSAVRVAAGPETGAATYPDAGPETGAAPGAASAGPDLLSRANARMIGWGSQSDVGWSAPTSASRPLAVGRWLESLARQRSTSGRIPGGT